jgi:hypothetical protein
MGGAGPEEGAPRTRRRAVAEGAVAVATTTVAAVVVAAIFLHRFPDGLPVLTRDITHYFWRTRLVSADGVHALVTWHPASLGVQAERSGLPALLGLIHVSGTMTLVLALRAVAAVVVGLAAGAFALEVLRERWYALPVFLLAVGASVQLARTSIGYLDNLLVDGAVMVTAVAALVAVDGRRGRILAVSAMGAAMLIHWFFALLFLALLAGVTLVLLPMSIRTRRAGAAMSATPSWRLGTVVGGSAVACAVAALAAPAFPTKLPPTGEATGKATSTSPLWLAPTLALAAVGGVSLWWPRSTTRRAGLALAALWAASVPLGLVVSAALPGDHLKVFRISAFAIGIPLLIAAGVIAACTLPKWWWARVLGGAAGAAVLVVLFLHSANVAHSAPETPIPRDLQQARVAGAYLEGVPGTRPVVFLSAGPSPRMLDGIARSQVPIRFIEDVWIYPGAIEDLDRSGPSTDARTKVRAQSAKWWDQIWTDPSSVLDRNPIVLYLSEFNRLLPPPSGAVPLAPGVLVVQGPAPSSRPTSSPVVPGSGEVGWAVVWMLLLLLVAGLGWSVALLDGSMLGRTALAPGVGVVALVIVGALLGRAGLSVTGATAWFVIAAVAASGWIAAALLRRRTREEGLSPEALRS